MFKLRYNLRGLTILLVLLLNANIQAEDVNSEYKSYKESQTKQNYLEISFASDWFEFTAEIDGNYEIVRNKTDNIKIENNTVEFSKSLYATNNGFMINGNLLEYENFHSSSIEVYDDYSLISFIRHVGAPSRVERFKRGNIIEPMSDITVEADQFVRGMVFSVNGDIHIYGEVNKDVISLLGDIIIHEGSFIRGNIVTITGEIQLSDEASVYGEVISGNEKDKRRRKKWQKTNEIKFEVAGHYNRVDGFAPMAHLAYKDLDSLLPEIYGTFGYAFEAERTRFDIGFKQALIRSPFIAIGGEYYRDLSSDDDWLLGNDENTIYALLITQDYKDYYEAEGGTVYSQFKPIDGLDLTVRYRHEETRWFDHHPDLWSVFGGRDRFDQNFASVDPSERISGIQSIDTGTIATLTTQITYDSRDDSDPFLKSAWLVKGEFELSDSSINSDYSYKRYRVSAVRYQKLHRRLMLMVRGMYGWSDDNLPMHRKFYLGGLGTLRGYDYKEFSGEKFWMINTEYLLKTPQPGLSFSLLWDMARITNNKTFSDEEDIKQSVGVALYLGNDFRVSLAKRLDRSFDDEPKFNVRLAHVF